MARQPVSRASALRTRAAAPAGTVPGANSSTAAATAAAAAAAAAQPTPPATAGLVLPVDEMPMGDQFDGEGFPIAEEEPPPVVLDPAPVGMPKRVRIMLEDHEDLPPNGVPVGVNGRAYLIMPGEEVNVPVAVLEALNNATMLKPIVNGQTRQITGYRKVLRFPYRRV